MKAIIAHIEELIMVYETRKKYADEKYESTNSLYWEGRRDSCNTTLTELRGILKLLND